MYRKLPNFCEMRANWSKRLKVILFFIALILCLLSLGRKAGEDLKEVVGMSVRSHCATRFSMKFLLLHRLLQLKNVLPQILLSNAINNLRVDQWILLEECCRLLKPFAEFTDMLGMESDATISLVIPSIQALSVHLQVDLSPVTTIC